MYVLILEDHDIVAASLGAIVRSEFPDLEVIKSDNFQSGISRLKEIDRIILVILDIGLPGGGSYEMISDLRRVRSEVKILVFTADEEPRTAMKFLRNGANGYLTKRSSFEEVSRAVKAVIRGQSYVTDEVQRIITSNFLNDTFADVNPESFFSAREKEVLDMLLEGKQTKQIATELNLKLTTVSSHKARIFAKMKVTNVIDLFRKVKGSSPHFR